MHTPDYVLVADEWTDLRRASAEAFGGNRKASSLPVALELERAYVLRDETGRIFHKYPLSTAEGSYYLRHYISYVADPPELFDLAGSKSTFLTIISMVLRRLALVRRRITILEIGSTIGENYDLLKHHIAQANLPIEIEFVGIEVSESLTSFAQIAHRRDPHFTAIADDGAELGRFPNNCFDLVICNAVAGFVGDPQACFAGIARVCRIAVLLALEVSDGPLSIWRSGAQTHKRYYAPRRSDLDDMWRPYGPFHDYLVSRGPFLGLANNAGGTGYFLGDQKGVEQVAFERHIVARFPLFPAADALRRSIA